MLSTPTYFIAFALVTMVSSGLAQRDYRQFPTPRAPISNEPCTAPGLMCKDCTNVQSCVSNGPGNTDFTAIPVQTCGADFACLNGACVDKKETNPFCSADYDTFICPDYGMFPDPAYCKKFFICVPKPAEGEASEGKPPQLTPTSWDCESGYGYNARTKVCDKKLTNNQCPIGYPVPLCKSTSQTAALAENPSIYYICGVKGTSLYPFLQTCKNGKVYNSRFVCA